MYMRGRFCWHWFGLGNGSATYCIDKFSLNGCCPPCVRSWAFLKIKKKHVSAVRFYTKSNHRVLSASAVYQPANWHNDCYILYRNNLTGWTSLQNHTFVTAPAYYWANTWIRWLLWTMHSANSHQHWIDCSKPNPAITLVSFNKHSSGCEMVWMRDGTLTDQQSAVSRYYLCIPNHLWKLQFQQGSSGFGLRTVDEQSLRTTPDHH